MLLLSDSYVRNHFKHNMTFGKETGPLLAVSCDLRQMCESQPGAETQRPHQVQTESKSGRTSPSASTKAWILTLHPKLFSDATDRNFKVIADWTTHNLKNL